MTDVTRILSEIEQGDPKAADLLLPLVYEELRKLAAAKLAYEKAIAASPEDESKASRLKRALKKTRFRPRWINGSAEAVTGVERTYEWFR